MTNNNHEVIFAIVNSGFAEDVMDVAPELGVRDTVLNAIYKEMGMARKAQGIVFSLPVNEAVGSGTCPRNEIISEPQLRLRLFHAKK